MIDFPMMPEFPPKYAWVLSGLMYFLILAFYNKWALMRPASTSVYPRKDSLFILVLFFCLFAIYCGDWVHMQIVIKGSVGLNYNDGFGVERIYHDLANLLKGNYLLFRTIVWGLGLFCTMQAFKLCDVDPYRCLFFLFGLYITLFAYSRASMGHALFYYGSVLLFQDKRKRSLKTIIIAVVLITSSVYAHRSMLALVLLLPITLFPINKRTWYYVVFGTVVVMLLWSILFQSVMVYLLSSDEYSYKIESYEAIAGSSGLSFNLNGLFYLWNKGSIHVVFWYSVIQLYKRVNQGLVSLPVQAVFRISIILYFFVIMMLVSYGNESAFYYRYETMLYLPLTIMMGYLFQNGYIERKRYVLLFWIFSLSQCKDFIYRIFFT